MKITKDYPRLTRLDNGDYTLNGNLVTSDDLVIELDGRLTVGGSLFLSNTQITALPDNLTVGGSLDLSNTQITDERAAREQVRHLRDGDYVAGRYLYADGILTHIKKRKAVGAYTVYVGKIPHKNVVSDGTNYAHCDSLRDGIADLLFKAAEDRGAEQYKNLSLDTELTVSEAVTMYRVITGACRAGSQAFVDSLGELKEKYTIREAIELTKGQYNAEKFAEFFEGGE